MSYKIYNVEVKLINIFIFEIGDAVKHLNASELEV